MNTSFKQLFLHLSKSLGLFHVSRHLTRRGLRILCYHGLALEDEHLFRAGLFMTYTTFQKRLEFIEARGYPVLGLESALDSMDRGDLPNWATVITIDDGFYSSYKHAFKLLSVLEFPATFYVTTYYCVKENPIFRLVVQYMLWKTKKPLLELSHLHFSLSGAYSIADVLERDKAAWKIIDFGEEQCDEQERTALASRLGSLLSVDFEHIRLSHILSLVNRDEVKSLAAQGVDIQLHTHRHRLPLDETHAMREILDNKAVLEPLAGKELQHLCYPSGLWSQEHWPWLAAARIKSATTCDAGLNYAETPKLALRRFLDGEDIAEIEFEAELAGYNELLRRMRSTVKRLWARRGNRSCVH